MTLIVVYESMFGNTKMVAEAIAEGLAEVGEVTVGTVDEIPMEMAIDASLVVAGGPTHAFGMARRNARRRIVQMDVKHKYPPVLPGTMSLREWLAGMPFGDTVGAAFDTRFHRPKWLTGSAAAKIARRLNAKGFSVIETESFFVTGTGGPLASGERERAVAWGRTLARDLTPRAAAA